MSRGDFFCNFYWHVKSNLYLQWSPFVLHMQRLHHVNQEQKEHVLSCQCSVQYPFCWYEHNNSYCDNINNDNKNNNFVIINICDNNNYDYLPCWRSGFFCKKWTKGFSFYSLNEMEINNLLKNTQADASYRMLEHDDITADQTKTVLCFYKWHDFQTDLKPVVNRE